MVAATAEAIQLEERERLVSSTYLSADLIPELQEVRVDARAEAYQIVENNRQLLLDGKFEEVPIDVDALGTARKLAEVERAYGRNSQEYTSCRTGLVLDCRRLYAEAVRKNTYEYFPLVKQKRDHQTGEYFSHEQSMLTLTEGGLSPIVEPEEVEHRVNERVEEVTYHAIGRMSLAKTVNVLTVSECTDWAIAAYHRNSKGGHGGYVPEIEKLMVRNVIFDAVSKDRFEEQVGVSGKYITHEVVVEAYRRRDIYVSTKTEVHSTQAIHDDDVFDFIALLDQVASEFSGKEIFMGEELKAGQAKDYSRIRGEAIERQRQLDAESERLADFIIELEADGTDRWLAVKLVEDRVKEELIAIAFDDNIKAADIFDERTAQGLRQVSQLQARGMFEEAMNLLDEVIVEAPTPGYCGAGSCGLEEIKLNSKEAKAMEEMGLDPTKGLKDTVRTCKNCRRKTVVYDQTNKKKGCISKDCNIQASYK